MDISEHLKINYEINKTFICSTAHITEETSEYLGRIVNNGHGAVIVHEKSDYGYFVVTDEDLILQEEEIPDDLMLLLKIAIAHDCYYLELDVDGPQYDNLPQYEW